MKKVRKGFTLVELLIVIAVLGSLGAMMSYSSSGAVDSADAAKIITNLQTLKMAAMQMYIEKPEVASLTAIDTTNETTTAVTIGETNTTVAAVLGEYLGKKADALTASGAAKKYGLVGNATSWYVVYALDTDDSTGVKTKLAAQAQATDIYGGASAAVTAFTDYYAVADTTTHIALKVR